VKEYLTSRKIFSFAALEIFSFLTSIIKMSLGDKLQQNATQGCFGYGRFPSIVKILM
jgi:hypothetical protein